MVLFNYTSKELTAKIVYYGPGLCGKTTNLQFIYDNLPAHVKKGKMLSLATKTDRTLFFDFLPIELGKIGGMKTRVQLYTVPGQVFYNSTRKLVLKGADGLVFVADSQQKMMESNGESYKNLEENLKEIGLKLEEMPLVMQFNKRDLPHLASVEEMNTLINRHNAPFYEAVATTGIGVEDTLKAVTKLVLNHLAAKYNLGAAPEPRAAAPEETVTSPGTRPGAVTLLRGGGKSVSVAPDPGEMEIEQNSGAGESLDSAPAAGPGPDRQAEATGSFDLDESPTFEPDALDEEPPSPAVTHLGERETAAGGLDDLEIVDLGEVSDTPAPPSPVTGKQISARPEPPEDFSDLLEELPVETGDGTLPTMEEPVPDFKQRKAPAPAPERPAPRAAAPAPLRPVPEAPRGGSAPEAAPMRETVISRVDPLGIVAGRSAEAPAARAIQVGAVIPGREHEITVPLEMSVEGKKVRLNLKMTLTLSR